MLLIKLFTVNNDYLPLTKLFTVNNNNLQLIKLFIVNNNYLPVIKLFRVNNNYLTLTLFRMGGEGGAKRPRLPVFAFNFYKRRTWSLKLSDF